MQILDRTSTPTGHIRILIVDDDAGICRLLNSFLTDHLPGAVIHIAHSTKEGRRWLAEAPYDLLVCDIVLPDGDGRTLMIEVGNQHPDTTVVAISGSEQGVPEVVRMFRAGAADFIPKPIDLDRVALVADRVTERVRLHRENHRLRSLTAVSRLLPGMVGVSDALAEVARQVEVIARRSTTVLVRGESGTGKELVAKAIHVLSDRRQGPFTAINVAAVPDTILEGELFGYAKTSGVSGAPPGGRRGLFEMADGGTLFLDEIGDMSMQSQSKILRVLQEKEIMRIGANEPTPIDIRIVCATHQDLEQAVADQRFRGDLLYRLNTFEIFIPPLRERPEDIEVLARHFLTELGDEASMQSFAQDALDQLRQLPLPGNVRELRALIERLSISTEGRTITAVHVERETSGARARRRAGSASTASLVIAEIATRLEADAAGAVTDGATAGAAPGGRPPLLPLKQATEAFEAAYLKELVERAHWNVSQAAEISGLSRTYLHRLLGQHGFKRPI